MYRRLYTRIFGRVYKTYDKSWYFMYDGEEMVEGSKRFGMVGLD